MMQANHPSQGIAGDRSSVRGCAGATADFDSNKRTSRHIIAIEIERRKQCALPPCISELPVLEEIVCLENETDANVTGRAFTRTRPLTISASTTRLPPISKSAATPSPQPIPAQVLESVAPVPASAAIATGANKATPSAATAEPLVNSYSVLLHPSMQRNKQNSSCSSPMIKGGERSVT